MPAQRKVRFRASWPPRAETPDEVALRLSAFMLDLRGMAPYAEPIYAEGMGRVVPTAGGLAASFPFGGQGGETRMYAGGRRALLDVRAGVTVPGSVNHVRLDLLPPEGELEPSLADRIRKSMAAAFDAGDVLVTDDRPPV